MIKKLNDAAPGVKRPIRVKDLQNLWDGLKNALALTTSSIPRIVSGFDDKGDGTWSAGVVAFNGTLYYHPDDTGYPIQKSASVYGVSRAGDTRVFADGTTKPFDYDQLATASDTSGVLIGTFSAENVAAWKGGTVSKYRPFSVALVPVLTSQEGVPMFENQTEDVQIGSTLYFYEYNTFYHWQLTFPAAFANQIVDGSLQVTFSKQSPRQLEAVTCSAVGKWRPDQRALDVTISQTGTLEGGGEPLITAADRANVSFLLRNS